MLSDLLRLDDQVAIVTGGSSGLGLAASAAFAELGAEVAIIARDPVRGAAAVRSVAERGGRAAFHALDVCDAAAAQQVIDRVLSRHGAPTVVLHAAGALVREDLPRSTAESVRAVMGPSVDGALNILRPLLPAMEARGGGSVILTSSYLALRGGAGQMPVYNAAKAALLGLMHSLAVRYGPSGIRVNAILPAFIETPLNQDLITSAPDPAAKRRELGERFPLRRIGTPADFAHAAVFLASDLSSWITGHGLVLDGGLTT